MILTLDLVPKPLHGMSLAQRQRTPWSKIRAYALSKHGIVCMICGSENRSVEVHEIWEYKMTGSTGIQRLLNVEVICPDCHHFRHFGRSELVLPPKQLGELKSHAMRVNGCTLPELNEHIRQAREAWHWRNHVTWTQDLSPWLPYQCNSCPAVKGLSWLGDRWECSRCAKTHRY